MKTTRFYPLAFAAAILSIFSACKKETAIQANTKNTTTTATTSTVALAGAIAIGTTTSLASGIAGSAAGNDSLYVMHCLPPRGKKDSVAFSALPTAIGTYLTANYAGYTAVKAFQITDSTKTVINYITVIKFNGNLVGLKFTAAGVFVNVLEQRAGADLGAPAGCHPGGPFGGRDGVHPDSIALSAIPTVVKTYFTTTYTTDTLLHADVAPDGTFILISKNKTLFATAITPAGALVKRMQIDGQPAKHTAVLQANLPAAITTYLTATYPAYVFDKAFSISNSSGTLGYVVLINANSTKYAVAFDESGTFVKASAVR